MSRASAQLWAIAHPRIYESLRCVEKRPSRHHQRGAGSNHHQVICASSLRLPRAPVGRGTDCAYLLLTQSGNAPIRRTSRIAMRVVATPSLTISPMVSITNLGWFCLPDPLHRHPFHTANDFRFEGRRVIFVSQARPPFARRVLIHMESLLQPLRRPSHLIHLRPEHTYTVQLLTIHLQELKRTTPTGAHHHLCRYPETAPSIPLPTCLTERSLPAPLHGCQSHLALLCSGCV